MPPHTRFSRICLRSSLEAWTVLCLICSLIPASAQSTAQVSRRDPQALAILTQTIVVSGGVDLLRSIQDVTETGTVTYNTDDAATGTVTIKSRGQTQFRMDADLSGSRRKTVVSGDYGALQDAEGQFRPIHTQSSADLENLTLPYLSLIEAIQDSSTTIIYVGLESHNGASVYDIRIERKYPPKKDPTGTRGPREAHDIYINPQSFRVSSISDEIHFSLTRDDGVPHEVLYSNYQTENGIAMPLTIVETTYGVTGVKIQLNQVTFNSGLNDSDFAW